MKQLGTDTCMSLMIMRSNLSLRVRMWMWTTICRRGHINTTQWSSLEQPVRARPVRSTTRERVNMLQQNMFPREASAVHFRDLRRDIQSSISQRLIVLLLSSSQVITACRPTLRLAFHDVVTEHNEALLEVPNL